MDIHSSVAHRHEFADLRAAAGRIFPHLMKRQAIGIFERTVFWISSPVNLQDPRIVVAAPAPSYVSRLNGVFSPGGFEPKLRSDGGKRAASCWMPSHFLMESLPDFSAARAIPDLAALIFSAYCSGIRVDFQPPACVIAAKSISRSARSCVAPMLVEWPLTRLTNRSGIPIHCATRLKVGAMVPGFRDLPT
jgi:hypothetical protein